MIFATLALSSQSTQAAVTQAWVHRYSNIVSNSVDHALKIVRDAEGNIIVTGTSDGTGSDILTVKYSGADGSVLWQQRYNGPKNSDDIPTSIGVDHSGNVVVAGSSYNGQPCWCYNDLDFYMAKYAAGSGALLWEKRHHGPGNYDYQAPTVASDGSGDVVVAAYFFSSDVSGFYTAKFSGADGALVWEKRAPDRGGYATAVDANGNVLVSGILLRVNGGFDSYTAKYAAADGALIWEHHHDDPAIRYATWGVAVDGSGNLVVTGHSRNESNLDYFTAKYAATDGALIWERHYNGPANRDDQATSVAVDGSGNVIVTGQSQNGDAYKGNDFYTAKYAAADGALLWEKRYNGPANREDGASAVMVDGSGNVIVTGFSQNSETDNENDNDYYTVKYAAADGAVLWEKRYDGYGADEASALTLDANGDVFVTGSSYNDRGNPDYYTARYAAVNGALVWEQSHTGPSNREDRPSAVVVDAGGNVLVTGESQNDRSNTDYYTAKYAATDGELLWEKRGPAGVPAAAALDGSGNVFVAGISYNVTNSSSYMAKYATADGALLWEQRYNSPGSSTSAMALSVDGNGNMVVTGVSSERTNTYSYTAKYATADGSPIWRQLYSGPGIWSSAKAVAIDRNGDVVASGTVIGSPSSGADYLTTKYASADGALLWVKHYNGPANRYDYATAVVVDGSDNVVVTGSSATSGSIYSGFIDDYYTAKYAAADGALLWERRYNGPRNGSDHATAIAVDGRGDVVVTGVSQGDYYTAKYAAADGALLWEKRGPTGVAGAVRVDGSGNVVVTGSTDNGPDSDYYTAKYAATDGALLWEKRYNGPANGDDFASGLALGPNGIIAITGYSVGNCGSGSAYDYATVVYPEAPSLSIALVAGGVWLRSTGIPGDRYNLERAPIIAGDWTTINTLTAPASGILEYLDTPAHAGPVFYRIVRP